MAEEPGMGTATTTTPPRKYSRYRLRQQVESEAPASGAPKQEDAISRSKSRYRRPGKKHDPLTSPPVPRPLPPPLAHTNEASPPKLREGVRRVTDPVPSSEREQPVTRHPTVGGKRASRHRETETERQQRKAREVQEQEFKHRNTLQVQEAQELKDAAATVEQAQLAEEEASQILAEQKRRDLKRLEAELEAAAPVGVLSPGREKFGFFSRKRATTRTTPPAAFGSKKATSSRNLMKSPSYGSPPPYTVEPPSTGIIEQGGGGIVLGNHGTDAPISASNSGARRVLIRYKQSSIYLPVIPETTATQLIYSAANILPHTISPTSAVLLESYIQLGLERRVRRYEHVRDIMNSWDQDSQNALVLDTSDSLGDNLDLETSSVVKNAPKDLTVYLYHSQKPGKWNKRYVTLLSTGQIFMSKKNSAKLGDKDSINLCHLSDFDIYHPTSSQLRNSLRPPKRHCHAIKSQQRTTMFLSTENFVHFFSTDMKEVAEIWYNAVQSWRCWYLVNKMGEGKTEPKAKTVEVPAHGRRRAATTAVPPHMGRVSVDEEPYTIGSFKPILNMDRFSPQKEAANHDSEDENRPLHIPSHLRKNISPSRPEKREYKPPPLSYHLPAEEEEFATTGLLGRSYSQRQKDAKQRECAEKQGNSIGDGSSLTSRPGHHRTNSMKSTRSIHNSPNKRPVTSAGSSVQRHATTREKPKPLLDFTPQFKEAPQWDKTGKGHGVHVKGVKLVEAATTPDDPLGDIPKASGTLFTRPTTSHATASKDAAFVKGGLVSGGR